MVKRLSIVACLLASLTAIPSIFLAQQKPQIMPLVPAADWRQMDSKPLPVSAVSKYGGDPAIEREYGVKDVELRTYQVEQTPIKVLVEPAANAASAYGLLTFYRTASMLPVKGIALAYSDDRGTLMARGKNFIRFPRPQEPTLSQNDYQALLLYVGGAQGSENTPDPMPQKDLVPGNVEVSGRARSGQTSVAFFPHGFTRIRPGRGSAVGQVPNRERHGHRARHQLSHGADCSYTIRRYVRYAGFE